MLCYVQDQTHTHTHSGRSWDLSHHAALPAPRTACLIRDPLVRPELCPGARALLDTPGPRARLSPECFSAPCIGVSSQIRDYSRPLNLRTAALHLGCLLSYKHLGRGPSCCLGSVRPAGSQVGGLGGLAVGLPEMRSHIQEMALLPLNRRASSLCTLTPGKKR